MVECVSCEDDIFFDAYGMRLWEKRHAKVTDILKKHDKKNVKKYFNLF